MTRAAAAAQPLWALVPPVARARYLRRAAMAILDDLDALADLLAEEVGQPRTEALLAELLPSVGGLHGLAADGPAALADRRLGPVPALRAGRRSVLVQSPIGVVGIAVRDGAAWAGPALEAAASLLAGNAVLLAPAAPRAAVRLRAAFVRAGLPEALLELVDPSELDACGRLVALEPPPTKGVMLVLDGAPLDRVVTGALWAAFAGAGRRHAAVGRVVAVRSLAPALAAGIERAARGLRVGDPRLAETEVGPLASRADRERVEALVAAAEAAGAVRLCGGPRGDGAYYDPVVLRAVAPDARILHEPVPGPVLALQEAAGEAEAIALARQGSAGEADAIALARRGSAAADRGATRSDPDATGAVTAESAAGSRRAATVSVWAGDRSHGERVARALGAEIAWVNEHGVASPAAPVRLARHVEQRQLALQPTRLRSARWLPYDPALAAAATAAARLVHGRASERWPALRDGAGPLARTAIRLGREALGR